MTRINADAEHGFAEAQRPVQNRIVNRQQDFHQRICIFGTERPANEGRAQRRHERDGQHRRASHRKCFGERERVKQFSFLSGQREHRHEREDDDDHREENRASDLLCRFKRDLQRLGLVQPRALLFFRQFAVANGIFGHDDARVHEHADGDGNAGERHDV